MLGTRRADGAVAQSAGQRSGRRVAPDPARNEDVGRLLIDCPDRPGIVAAVSRLLYERGANIVHSDQHSTGPVRGAGTFFMRIEFTLPGLAAQRAALERDLAAVAAPFGMTWRLSSAARVKRLAVFVSRAEHALLELLWRQRAGDLRARIVAVISNHPDLADVAASWGVPFHHVPVTPERRAAAEAHQLALCEGQADALVLARYMQVLSPAFVARFPNRIINIHHSFLPAFAGANPYAAAYARGVKLIGATAHYVTAELDGGPIIEQDVQRVDHGHAVADLRRIGRHIERMVLARAVEWHVEDRTLVHEGRTIVFA